MAMLLEKVYVIPTIESVRTTYKGDQSTVLTSPAPVAKAPVSTSPLWSATAHRTRKLLLAAPRIVQCLT
jgi:hypothetical protein